MPRRRTEAERDDMPVPILIPTALRAYTEGRDRVEAEGRTVGELLTNLAESFGELRRHLFNDEGKLRSFVNVYVNDEDFRYLERESTPVGERDVVSIVPSIAGGSREGNSACPI
jgi:molybdopterin converting factor small subunit